MTCFHRAYGLTLASNQPIPGLRTVTPQAADLEVCFGEAPADMRAVPATKQQRCGLAATRDDVLIPSTQLWRLPGGLGWRIAYEDGTEFFFDAAGRRLWQVSPAAYSVAYVCTYLVGAVMGFALRLRGIVSLHASAVLVDGRAVAFIGPPGAGKSTVAAAFASAGFQVLCDDLAPLRIRGAEISIAPGFPRLRLWPESAQLLLQPDLPPIVAGWDKRELRLDEAFCDAPAALAAIYQVERAAAPDHEIVAVTARDALLAIAANTSVNYLLERGMRAHEMGVLQQLVQRTMIRRLRIADGPAGLRELPYAICADLRCDARDCHAMIEQPCTTFSNTA